MLKKTILVLMALGLMLTLSGCYKLNSDVSVNDDDTVSGTIVMAFPKRFPDEYKNSLPTLDQMPAGVTTATYVDGDEDDGYTGITYTLNRVSFADLAKTNADGNGLPFTMSKDEEGTYVLQGDFTAWFPTKNEVREKGLPVPKPFAKPKVLLQFTFPYNISKAPEGLTVQGPSVTIKRDWLETNRRFTVKAAANSEGRDAPAFADLPSRPAADTSAYPMQVTTRSPLPNYVFGAMLGLGIIAIIYGHYASRSRGPRR